MAFVHTGKFPEKYSKQLNQLFELRMEVDYTFGIKIDESVAKKKYKQAEEIISKAKVAMEQERERVLREAREEIAALVVLTTSKVLSKDLSAEEKERFTNRASEELNLVS